MIHDEVNSKSAGSTTSVMLQKLADVLILAEKWCSEYMVVWGPGFKVFPRSH